MSMSAKVFLVLAWATLTVITTPALKAEDRLFSPEFEKCLSSHNITMQDASICMVEGAYTYNLNECMDKELERQDARLNAAYKEAVRYTDYNDTKIIREAQRTWIKFRNTFARAFDIRANLETEPGDPPVPRWIIYLDRCQQNYYILESTAEQAKRLEWFNSLNYAWGISHPSINSQAKPDRVDLPRIWARSGN